MLSHALFGSSSLGRCLLLGRRAIEPYAERGVLGSGDGPRIADVKTVVGVRLAGGNRVHVLVVGLDGGCNGRSADYAAVERHFGVAGIAGKGHVHLRI